MTIIIPNKKELLRKFESKFNLDHFMKVLDARAALGIIFKNNNYIEDHPLLGKKCITLDTQKHYTVDKCFKQWHRGYYIVLALVDENKSHRIFFYQNISCVEPIIVEDIENNQKRIQFL
jgi:hypothetical protein